MSFRRAVVPALAVLTACAPADRQEDQPAAAAPPAPVTFTATDFAFSGPAAVPAGPTTLRIVNHGAEPHHVMIARLDSNRTVEDLLAALEVDEHADPAWASWRGGVNVVMPHDSAEASSVLEPGRYAAFCFVPSPDGTPHFAKGMFASFEVTGPMPAATPPAADVEVTLTDYAFTLSAPLTAGPHVIRVRNEGTEVHEVALVKLHDGTTLEQFLASVAPGAAGPPLGTALGGSGAFSTGYGGWWRVNLTPGHYALFCWVPSPDGTPHVMKGMMKEFTIS